MEIPIAGHLHGSRVIEERSTTWLIRSKLYGVLPIWVFFRIQYLVWDPFVYIPDTPQRERDEVKSLPDATVVSRTTLFCMYWVTQVQWVTIM